MINPLSYFYVLRSYVDAYAGVIGRRFVSAIWIAAICVVIWFYGYLAEYGDFKPLASVDARLIAIGVVLAIWIVYLFISAVRARRRDDKLVEGIERDAAAEAAASQQAEVGEIHARLKEALSLLRRITRKRYGYIYELPWYVIFGAPGSGKTTALTNSGLKFPLGDALGTNAVQGIGGTRNCNWWFADQAILIDTAGRYTTQDDLNGASKAGWEGFLGLLRKYRRSQPINGALVTLSIGDLMHRDTDEQYEEVRAIRQRLSDLDNYLHARIPVYVVLTKADLLTGFVEFFDGLNKSDREQVWGTTFQLDESYAGANLADRLMEEFALLQERVDAMLIERLQQEQNAELRGRIFRFPAELAALKERLHGTLSELCASSRLVEAPLVRGVYFASGTQMVERSAEAAVPRVKRSYFLTRLFNDVIFDEASLVSRDRRLSRRRIFVRQATYAAAVILLAFVFTAWSMTYVENSRALASADAHIAAYRKLIEGVAVRDVSDADFLRVLPPLDHLRAVTSGFEQRPVWTVSLGLDQSEKVTSRQRDAYQRALTSLLLPRMLVELQTEMKEEKQPAKAFDELKLYGMLGGLGPVEPEFVEARSQELFERLYPGDGRTSARAALLQHVQAMTEGTLPPVQLDNNLIAKARDMIRDRSLATRAFDILASYRQTRRLAPWTPADSFGPLGEQVFERISKAPFNEGIQGFYTTSGYRGVVLPRITAAAREALNETWVRGTQSNPPGMTVDGVAQAALQLYFSNFVQRWSTLLADFRIRPSQSLGEAAETMRLLSASPSIVEAVARSIVSATDLRPPSGIEVAASDGTVLDSVAALAGIDAAPDPYGDLRAALESPKGNSKIQSDANTPGSEIASVQPALRKVYEQLARATTSSAEIARVFDVNSQLTNATQDLLQQARQLPEPVDTWLAGVTADVGSLSVKTARAQINNLWAGDGANLCAEVINGRYPFDRNSKRDVAMSDFVRLFGPEGLFQDFFKNRLSPFVDTSASPWGWKGTFGAARIPSEAIAQFENADKIYHAFFPTGSKDPAVSINVKPVSLSDTANAVMMEIEGERVVYFHGPIESKSIAWPSKESANLSRIAFQPGGWEQATTENGDWSPFRLFDDAKVVNERGDSFRAEFDNNGQQAAFDVQFGSVLNPFRLKALSDFACPSQF
jgi:type VI secretion system protein ImpL